MLKKKGSLNDLDPLFFFSLSSPSAFALARLSLFKLRCGAPWPRRPFVPLLPQQPQELQQGLPRCEEEELSPSIRRRRSTMPPRSSPAPPLPPRPRARLPLSRLLPREMSSEALAGGATKQEKGQRGSPGGRGTTELPRRPAALAAAAAEQAFAAAMTASPAAAPPSRPPPTTSTATRSPRR